MAAGDVLVLGPYNFNESDINTMSAALTAAQSGAATDQNMIINDMNGAFYVTYIKGA